VIIAEPGATASDFLALARLMARAVLFKFGIQLEPEVCGLDVW
jgi:UDP-N-acetylenolpyruvoylglucosamine reductase